jgi:hypothetical protein
MYPHNIAPTSASSTANKTSRSLLNHTSRLGLRACVHNTNKR